VVAMVTNTSLSLRLLLSETKRHAVRAEDEVQVDDEDGHEPQLHLATPLQSPGHVLSWDRRRRRRG